MSAVLVSARSALTSGGLGVRRLAAFDIGSGSMKVQVSDVDIVSGRILTTLYEAEKLVLYGEDLKRGTDGALSAEIQSEGFAVLQSFKAVATSLNASAYRGVGTEVFRRASNGSDHLKRLDTLIPIQLVSQQKEAELGFSTVCAVLGIPASTPGVIVWDSGGASFQITTTRSQPSSPPAEASSSELDVYCGSLGTSVSIASLLHEVQHRDCASQWRDVNPVTRSSADDLVSNLLVKLGSPPPWLVGADVVFAAAGSNSLFRLCCIVLGGGARDGVASSARSSPPVAVVTSFSYASAVRAFHLCLESTDEQLAKYQAFDNAEGTHAIVPKLALLVAVMTKAGIKEVRTVTCTGSCAGVLVDRSFWD